MGNTPIKQEYDEDSMDIKREEDQYHTDPQAPYPPPAQQDPSSPPPLQDVKGGRRRAPRTSTRSQPRTEKARVRVKGYRRLNK